MLKARKAVLEMKEYHPPLSGREGLRLDFNENTVGCSPRVLAKLRSITADQLARYPEREPGERTIAAFLGVSAAQVLLTNGVDEAIHLLCECYLQDDDEVIIPTPTFSMYEIYAQQTGAKVITVQAADDLRFPVAGVLSAINARTKVIAIASPNNPTGAATSEEELVQVLKAAPHAAVLVDEAYFEFYGRTLVPLISRYANLFIARTFSKAFGLAGFRLGALVGSSDNLRMVRKVSSPYSVNGIALACLGEALADEAYLHDYSAQVREGRERLEKVLEGKGITYWKSEANFILLRLGEARIQFVESMKKRGILVRDRNGDPGCGGCVRITIGTREQMDQLLKACSEVLDGSKGQSHR
ncbi:MAG TPA: histidinol-phosphate transaminase [Terriglobales bacterium]|nr:histidinol-phosphate transaminase [Terriglobales bacterium]